MKKQWIYLIAVILFTACGDSKEPVPEPPKYLPEKIEIYNRYDTFLAFYNYEYDNLHRLTKKTLTLPSEELSSITIYEYSDDNKIITSTNIQNSHEQTFIYREDNKELFINDILSRFGLDGHSRIITETEGDILIKYEYNAEGDCLRINRVSDNVNRSEVYEYDDMNNAFIHLNAPQWFMHFELLPEHGGRRNRISYNITYNTPEESGEISMKYLLDYNSHGYPVHINYENDIYGYCKIYYKKIE